MPDRPDDPQPGPRPDARVALHGGAPLAVATRRDQVAGVEQPESVHRGHVAVVDGDGRLTGSLGVPEAVVFVRSAAKPFQATACLELIEDAPAGTVERPGPEELAVAWASHGAEPDQLAAVRRLLARSGTPPEQLTCPPAGGERGPDAAPARLRHNCSGKHAMFALAGAAVDCAGPRLLDRDGPVQTAVLAALRAAMGQPAAVGVDGCGAPAVAVPLAGLARGYLRLLDESRWRPVVEAGLAHPGLVGGAGRLTSVLLGAGVVAKVGAEGVYGAAWREPDGGRRALAVKAADGARRAAALVLWTIATRRGLVARDAWEPPVPTGGGRPAGTLAPSEAVTDLAGRAEE